jgi:3-oxoacyl-[acyl-carrier-protein] synthase-1
MTRGLTRRVVVTGMGIVASIGDNVGEVAASLRAGRSGLRAMPSFVEAGMQSGIAGVPRLDPASIGDRKLRRYLSAAPLYAWVAAQEALRGARLDDLRDPRIGLIVGSGTGSTSTLQEAFETARLRGASRVPPFVVPRAMGSTVSACLATVFGIRGAVYTLSSACATSAHCIGHAMELIQFGKQDVVIAGGAEEVHWSSALMFDAMGVLAANSNASPERACRPFDRARAGFAIAGGAAVLVLEERERALRRGAEIFGELTGYGVSCDGADMVFPSTEGAVRAMRNALQGIEGRVDYLNAHATGTPGGDRSEAEAIAEVFRDDPPLVSSTKGLTGHSIGAAAAQELIYTLIMMRDGFAAANTNLDALDPELPSLPLLRETRGADIRRALSLSLGFGGTNAALVVERAQRQ